MSCKVCQNKTKNLDLTKSPLAGYKSEGKVNSLSEPVFPLVFQYCPKCNFISYIEYEEATPILNRMYENQENTYLLSENVLKYVDDLAIDISKKFNLNKNSKVLEVGCNDGSLLYSINKHSNAQVLGIEPSKNFIEIWRKRKLNVINDFLTDNVSKEINDKSDLILMRHVLEHISDLDSIMDNLSKLMHDKSTLIIEVPYMVTVLNNRRIENTGYSHLNYFSIKSMKSLMRKFNLTLSSYEKIDTDGGSIIFYINKSERSNVIDDHISYDDLIGFKDYIEVRKHNIHKYLQNFHKDEIIGFGAGGKGQHLIHLLGLDMYCNKVLDNLNTNKNQYIPGTKIEIVSEDEINNPNLKLVLNLAPTHSKILKSKTPDRVIFYNIVEEEDKYFV